MALMLLLFLEVLIVEFFYFNFYSLIVLEYYNIYSLNSSILFRGFTKIKKRE